VTGASLATTLTVAATTASVTSTAVELGLGVAAVAGAFQTGKAIGTITTGIGEEGQVLTTSQRSEMAGELFGAFAGGYAATKGLQAGVKGLRSNNTSQAETSASLPTSTKAATGASAFETPASSAVQGVRLSMQLAAEEAAGARAPTAIKSFSTHAERQMLSRDSVGVSRTALEDAFANPLNMKYQPTKYGPTFQFVGENATVAVNADGKVTTAWATSSAGTRR
jgi:filamentous hemagglutinin